MYPSSLNDVSFSMTLYPKYLIVKIINSFAYVHYSLFIKWIDSFWYFVITNCMLLHSYIELIWSSICWSFYSSFFLLLYQVYLFVFLHSSLHFFTYLFIYLFVHLFTNFLTLTARGTVKYRKSIHSFHFNL